MLSASLIVDGSGASPGAMDFGPGGGFANPLDFRRRKPMCIMVTTRQAPDDDRGAQETGRSVLDLLTDGQRDCLRLVYQHKTSKDIARMLGVSPHTVDMRLRTAMKALGVASRIEAAQLLVQEEQALGIDLSAQYQPLVYQAPEIVPGADAVIFGSPTSDGVGSSERPSSFQRLPLQPSSDVGPPASGPPRMAGASNSVATAAMNTVRPGIEALDPGNGVRPFLSSRPWGARNELSIGTRLAWIFGIAVGSSLAFGSVLAALASLKTLL